MLLSMSSEIPGIFARRDVPVRCDTYSSCSKTVTSNADCSGVQLRIYLQQAIGAQP